jgi:hypothetical protein
VFIRGSIPSTISLINTISLSFTQNKKATGANAPVAKNLTKSVESAHS